MPSFNQLYDVSLICTEPSSVERNEDIYDIDVLLDDPGLCEKYKAPPYKMRHPVPDYGMQGSIAIVDSGHFRVNFKFHLVQVQMVSTSLLHIFAVESETSLHVKRCS